MRAAGEGGQFIHEFTPTHAAMGKTVKEIDDLLVHDVAPWNCLKASVHLNLDGHMAASTSTRSTLKLKPREQHRP